jgi:predicted RNA-binding protein (virulence factor B family)
VKKTEPSRAGKAQNPETINIREGEAVNLIVDAFTDLGVKVIINEEFEGMLYRDEIYRTLEIGESLDGFVKKIREDKKIDVTLRKGTLEDIADAKSLILAKLKEKKGFLPLSDDSPPELIRDTLQMSKKLFKKAVGGLYRDRLIEVKDDGIHLKI